MDEKLLRVVASSSNLTLDKITGTVRKHKYVHARMVYSYMRRAMGVGLKEIGKELGKDHSTIIAYLNRHEDLICSEDFDYANLYDRVVTNYGPNVNIGKNPRNKRSTSIEGKAKLYAAEKHKFTNHKYDGMPYSYHLSMVVEIANKFLHLVVPSDCDTVLAGCWTHDVIEDCRETYDDVKVATNWLVANLVYALTNEKGRSRDERANGRYYYGIRTTPNATFIKLCDRIANVVYSKKRSPNMFKVYRAEHPHFWAQLKNEKYEEMNNYLIELFND